jgi:hypothetical protein
MRSGRPHTPHSLTLTLCEAFYMGTALDGREEKKMGAGLG